MQDVRDKVAPVQPSFPRDVKEPLRRRASTTRTRSRWSTLALLSARRAARASCRMLADQVVVKRLERVAGVARVDVGGLTVRQVRIDLDPQRLRAYGITPAEVVDRAAATPTPTCRSGLLIGAKQRRDRARRGQGASDPRQFADIIVAQPRRHAG